LQDKLKTLLKDADSDADHNQIYIDISPEKFKQELAESEAADPMALIDEMLPVESESSPMKDNFMGDDSLNPDQMIQSSNNNNILVVADEAHNSDDYSDDEFENHSSEADCSVD